jgi:CRISPR/Cas system-associated endoribonuclease Cas2
MTLMGDMLDRLTNRKTRCFRARAGQRRLPWRRRNDCRPFRRVPRRGDRPAPGSPFAPRLPPLPASSHCQYSVFECLLEADEVEALRLRIGRLIAPEEDRVRIYRFCADCGNRTEIAGLGKLSEDSGVCTLTAACPMSNNLKERRVYLFEEEKLLETDSKEHA